MKLKNKGFTLIELLVVVAIIGVLATVVLSSLNSARAHARDAQRELNIKTIQTALEMYYLDHGFYPRTSNIYSYNTNWQTNLGVHLGITMPVDPVNESISPSSGGYSYRYFAHPSSSYCNGQAYFLAYNKENSNGDLISEPNDGVRMCNNSLYHYGNAFTVGMDRDGNLN